MCSEVLQYYGSLIGDMGPAHSAARGTWRARSVRNMLKESKTTSKYRACRNWEGWEMGSG